MSESKLRRRITSLATHVVLVASPQGVLMRTLIGVMLVCLAAVVAAQQPGQRQPFSSTQQAVKAVRSATVTIVVARPEGEGTGSGFVITPDGVIATAAHV